MKQKLILELEKEAERLHNSTRTDIPFLSPVHNYLRSKSNLYYHWSANDTSRTVNKAGAIAFIASFVFFTALQFAFPNLFIPKPGTALAGANPVTWDTTSHFTNNGATNGNYTGTTTPTNVSTANDEVKLTQSSVPNTITSPISTGTMTNYSSTALDSNNKLHVSYYNSSSTSLGYATNASGSWVTATIGSVVGGFGIDPSIAIDSNNKVYVSYGSGSLSDSDLIYATNASGSWATTTIDSTGNVGTNTSIAIDSNNKAHISYYDATNTNLKYATNTSGGWVYSDVDTTGTVGRFSSIALDSNDKAYISYYDTTNTNLKYATNASGSWVATTAETSAGNVGTNTSIAIDSNNKAHISYYDSTNTKLKYATNASGSWVLSDIDTSVNSGGASTSIALDSNNKVYVSYISSTYYLKYATNASGSWAITSLWAGGNSVQPSLVIGPYNKSRRNLSATNNPYISFHVTAWSSINIANAGYTSPGTISNMKINAGTGIKYKWNTVSWTGSTPANTSIKFRTRGADTEGGLASATWSGYYTSSGSSITTATSQWLEAEMTLTSTDGVSTPTLDNFTINYNNISVPTAPKQYRQDGTTQISNAGYTNESTVKLKSGADDNIDGQALTPQIEVNTTGTFSGTPGTPSGTTYNATNIPGDSSFPVSDADIGNVTGLVAGSHYYWKVRYTDASGRVSGWSSTAGDFTIDQTAPTGSSISINSGAQYVSSTSVTLTLNASDAASGMGQMQFSNDGINWSGWETYGTSKAWTLASGDGSKTVYAQFKDNAGNTSGQFMQTSQADFDGGTKTSIETNSAGYFKLQSGSGATGQAILRPDGVGLLTQWGSQYPASGEHWDKLDETSPDDDSTTVGPSNQDSIDVYTTSHSIPVGSTINSVKLYARIRGYDGDLYSYIKLGVHDGVDYSWWLERSAMDASWVNITDYITWTTNPRTGVAWTLAEIDNLQIGIKQGLSNNTMVTQLYAVVDHTGIPPASSGNLVSSSKDNGPGAQYGNISWGANVPSQTGADALRFQVASNNDNSTWNFIGPDGTAGSYYTTTGTQLHSSHNGNRYMKYKAYLQTADTAYSPTVYDVNIDVTNGTSDTITLDTASPDMGTITAKTQSGGSDITAETWQTDNDPYFEWSAPSDTSNIAGYYYALDNAAPESGGTWLELPNPPNATASVQYSADAVADGQHTFYVRAKDNAGNQAGTVGSFVIWVDANPPTSAVTITPTYVGPNTYTSSIINGTASDGAGSGIQKTEITIQRSSDNQYYQEGGNWSGSEHWINVGSGATWSYDVGTGNLGNNIQYTVISKTTDNAGNYTTSTSDSFTYDNEAGTSSITFPANDGKYNSTSWTGSVTGTASDTVSGIQKIDVRIKRNSDNYYYNGTNFVDSPDPSVRWIQATGTDSFSYAISAVKFTDSTNYTVESRLTDNAGNVQGTADSKTFLFDEAAPTGTIVIANDNPYTKNTSNWMQLTAAGDTEKMKISNNADLSPDGVNGDSGTWINFATSKQWTLSTGADGTRTVYVKFRDYATNESVLTYSDEIYLDTTPAVSAVTSPANASKVNAVSSITGTATDSGSGITNASQITIAIIKNVSGTDNYWNPALNGGAGGWAVDQAWFAVDQIAGTKPDYTWTRNTVLPTDWADQITKDYTIKVKSADDATNAGTEASITFTYDKELPSTPAVTSTTHAVESTWYNTGNVTISDISSTDTSGVAGYSYAWSTEGTDPDDTLDAGAPINYNSQTDGLWHFKVKAKDNANNWSLVKDFVVRIDTAGPTAGTPAFVANGIDDSQIRLTWGKYNDPHSGVKEYKIYRSTAKTSPEPDGNQTVPRPSYTNLVATVTSDGSESYTYDDTGLNMGWFYYRIEAYDNATSANMSEYAYSHSKTNFIPNAITDFTVNGGTGAVTILPSASHTVNLAWTSTDPDGASDITAVKYIITKPDGSTVHTQANVTCLGANCTSVSNGYAVSALSVTFGNTDAYGDYTIRAQTIDTIGIGGHIVNSGSVTVKLIPAGPTGIALSSDRSSRIDINSAGSPFTAPNSGAGVVSYKVYSRLDNPSGDDATWKSGANNVYSGVNQYYQDNSVTQGVPNYYKISAIDQSGNEGVLSTVSSTVPPKADAPINVSIQDVSQITGGNTDYRLFASWDKVTVEQVPDRVGYALYRSTDGITYDYLATIANPDTNYYLDVTVSGSNTYYYQLRTYDASYAGSNGVVQQGMGDASGATEPISIQPGTVDAVAPAISGVNVSAGVSTATITWNTNENADTLVKYGTTAGYGLKSGQYTAGEADSNTSHSVVLHGLTPGATYHYNVNSRDTSKNLGESGDQTFSTGQFSVGSLSSGTPSNNGAIITWETQATGNSIVEYRAESDASFKVAGNTSDNVTSHSVELTSLKNNTEYFFKVRSEREEGGDKITAQSEGIQSFRTKAATSGSVSTPAVSKVNETEVTATSVTIAWDTNIPMTSWVEYGTTESYGTTLGDDNMNTHHTVKISGLVSETTYHYRIKGKDQGGNEFISPDYTFKALAMPIITGVNIQNVGSYSTTITWSTNIATDSGINYGKDTNYGLRSGSQEMTTAHSLTLADLTDQTTYHFQIEVKDARGNAVKGEDKVFTTPLDIQGPKLSEIKISPLTGNDESKRGVIITWITDKEATAQVEYGAGVTPGKYDQKSPADPSFTTSHTTIISDLDAGTTYHFRLISKDKRGNEGRSQDFTMLTSEKEESILTLILKTLEETFSWVGKVRDFIAGQFSKLMGK